MTTTNPQPARILTLDEVVTLPGVPADHRACHGPDPAQFGDLYGRPVVLHLHGGCWRAQYGLTLVGQLAAALRQAGLAVWNLEYRRLGNGGGWPTTFQDVALGADFLRTLASQFALDLPPGHPSSARSGPTRGHTRQGCCKRQERRSTPFVRRIPNTFVWKSLTRIDTKETTT